MKTVIKKEFLERGYGQFPYIIIRQFSTLYSQIPLKTKNHENTNHEGIFIDDSDLTQSKNFDQACKLRFHKFWSEENKNGNPLDMCLVLNASSGYYISKEGKITENSIPSGGILKSLDNSVIQVNGQHYIVTKNEDQKNITRMMEELKSGSIQTKETFKWWINRY